jgi:hypothetical protein
MRKSSSRDRPADEVDQAMVSAGVRVLLDSGRLRAEAPGADELLVKQILDAAMKVPNVAAKIVKI